MCGAVSTPPTHLRAWCSVKSTETTLPYLVCFFCARHTWHCICFCWGQGTLPPSFIRSLTKASLKSLWDNLEPQEVRIKPFRNERSRRWKNDSFFHFQVFTNRIIIVVLYYGWFQRISILKTGTTFYQKGWGIFINMFPSLLSFHTMAVKSPLTLLVFVTPFQFQYLS